MKRSAGITGQIFWNPGTPWTPIKHDPFCLMLEKKISEGPNAVFAALLMEEYAVSREAESLSMDGSLTAESFYINHGYTVLGRSVHKLRGGLEMSCVKMTKKL